MLLQAPFPLAFSSEDIICLLFGDTLRNATCRWSKKQRFVRLNNANRNWPFGLCFISSRHRYPLRVWISEKLTISLQVSYNTLVIYGMRSLMSHVQSKNASLKFVYFPTTFALLQNSRILFLEEYSNWKFFFQVISKYRKTNLLLHLCV